jgi:hypothetical protein
MRTRFRSLFLTLTVATVTLSGVGSLGAGTAAAATPLTASITCDSATNTISTRLTGTLAPNFSYTMKFTVWSGSQVTTAGTISGLPAWNTSVSVPVTTGSNPDVDVAGYTRSWPAANYVFYTETVRVSVLNSSGGEITWRQGTCVRDLRTTVDLTCDQEAHTITATATGAGFARRPTRAEYAYGYTYQPTADSLAFTLQPSSTPDVVHSVPVSESGTWSDVGFVHQEGDDEPYFLSENVVVWVRDVWSNLPVGQGTASCVYADHRP